MVSRERRAYQSQIKNAPSFSIKHGNQSYKQIISKDHRQDLVGRETPGVGEYRVKPEAKQTPAWGMCLAQRFEQYSKINKHKVSNALDYYLDPRYRELLNKRISFSKAKRFQ